MRTILITQPMYFPWVGMLEQMALADVVVVYDDVQYSKGGVLNRVQIKTAAGGKWMTLPLSKGRLATSIRDMALDADVDWRTRHRAQLRDAYRTAPHLDEMLSVFDAGVASGPDARLGAIAWQSMLALKQAFSLRPDCEVVHAETLNIGGSGSHRVLDICRHLDATRYITGHGARNYLQHEQFDAAGIAVEYMDYARLPYPQLHGDFTPFVSGLDLLANCGSHAGKHFIAPRTMPWRTFIHQEGAAS